MLVHSGLYHIDQCIHYFIKILIVCIKCKLNFRRNNCKISKIQCLIQCKLNFLHLHIRNHFHKKLSKFNYFIILNYYGIYCKLSLLNKFNSFLNLNYLYKFYFLFHNFLKHIRCCILVCLIIVNSFWNILNKILKNYISSNY